MPTFKTTDQPQAGFALLPIIVIVAALLFGGTAVGLGVYATKNKSVMMVSPVPSLKLVEVSPEEPQKQELPMSSEQSEEQSTPIPEPSPSEETTKPTAKPAVAAATTVAPTQTTQLTNAEANIPLIVEQEFTAVFGRKPRPDESEYWKERMRKNSFDRAKLRHLMEVRKSEQKQPSASSPNTASAPSSQQNTQALQNYILLKGLLDSRVAGSANTAPAPTTPVNTEPSPEEQAALERLRQRQEEEARIAAEEHADSVARCKAAEDQRYANALDVALNDLAERGLLQSGIRIRTEEDLRADHDYRLWQCERI